MHTVTHQLLLMNGCDHQPLQKNITVNHVARKLYPDTSLFILDFKKYVEAMEKEISRTSTVKGELDVRKPMEDGRWQIQRLPGFD